jgi:hypothetical protein
MKRLFVSVFLILGWVNADALTLAQLRTQIRRNVGDTPSTQDLRRYGNTTLNAYLNEAQRTVVNLTWPMEDRQNFTLTAQTTFYTLPTNYLATKNVLYKKGTNATIQLEEKSERGMIDANPNWQLTAGQPINYLLIQSSTVSTYQMAFYPVPTTASTGTITHVFVKYPDDMDDDTDLPFDGKVFYVPYHDCLAYRVTGKILLAEGRAPEAQVYFQLFNDAVGAMKARIGMSPNYTPGVSGAAVNR